MYVSMERFMMLAFPYAFLDLYSPSIGLGPTDKRANGYGHG
jgi:hypothetical protein